MLIIKVYQGYSQLIIKVYLMLFWQVTEEVYGVLYYSDNSLLILRNRLELSCAVNRAAWAAEQVDRVTGVCEQHVLDSKSFQELYLKREQQQYIIEISKASDEPMGVVLCSPQKEEEEQQQQQRQTNKQKHNKTTPRKKSESVIQSKPKHY